MNTTIELTMGLIERIYALNLKFTHELMRNVTDKDFEGFKLCYYCLLGKKWVEYGEMN